MKKHGPKAIGDAVYEATAFTATEGLCMLPRIVNLFGERLLKVMIDAASKGLSGEEREAILSQPDVIAQLVSSLAQNAADGDKLLVVKDLMERTTCDKVLIGDAQVKGSVYEHFDSHFAGRYMHLAEVALWVASVNFLGP